MLTVLAAVIFGGGGSAYATLNLVAQLVAAATLALNPDCVVRFATYRPRVIVLLVVATVALPLLQIVPLPFGVWQSLPGRELTNQSLSLIDESQDWRVFSLDGQRTLLAAIGLLPPLAVVLLFVGGVSNRTVSLLRLVVIAGALNAVAGAIQLASGQRLLNFYPGAVGDQLYGFFANHNSAALFFVLALCALAAFPREEFERQHLRILYACCAVVFVLATILTQSRSGSVLLLLPIGLMVSRIWRESSGRSKPKAVLTVLVGGGVVLASLFALGGAKFSQTVARFSLREDSRAIIWSDATIAIHRYLPVGAGMGVFAEVFQVDETLENVQPKRAGRAHNDYLELAMEAGVAGLLLVVAWIAWILTSWWRKRHLEWASCRTGALIAVTCVALQSFVDYPLRNEAILSVAALFVGIIAASARGRPTKEFNCAT